MSSRNLFLVAGCAALFAACDSQPTAMAADEPVLASSNSAALNRDLAQVRAATARFHDVDVALAEGYQPVSECVSVPELGGMGIHFAKLPLLFDAGYSPTEPEALLYEPQADGSLKLVAVEYVVMQEAWHGAGNTGLPTFHGHPFDIGPAGPDSPATYTLHSWVWQPNPTGIFTPFNPKVTCPAGSEDDMAGHNH